MKAIRKIQMSRKRQYRFSFLPNTLNQRLRLCPPPWLFGQDFGKTFEVPLAVGQGQKAMILPAAGGKYFRRQGEESWISLWFLKENS